MINPVRWESGDLVRLKSGGPLMVIAYMTVENEVARRYQCHWFDKTDKVQTCNFLEAQLKLERATDAAGAPRPRR